MSIYLFITSLLFRAQTVFADTHNGRTIDYQPLEPNVPFLTTGETPELGPYIGNIFELGITIAIILAVIMIIAGGFEYMTSEAAGSKQSAKKRIGGAVIGLLLAMSTYVILNTINPKILDFNILINNVNWEVSFEVWYYQRDSGEWVGPMEQRVCETTREEDSEAREDQGCTIRSRDGLAGGNETNVARWIRNQNNKWQVFLTERECRDEFDGECTLIVCEDCVKTSQSYRSECWLGYDSCYTNYLLNNKLERLVTKLREAQFGTRYYGIFAWPWLREAHGCLSTGECVVLKFKTEEDSFSDIKWEEKKGVLIEQAEGILGMEVEEYGDDHNHWYILKPGSALIGSGACGSDFIDLETVGIHVKNGSCVRAQIGNKLNYMKQVLQLSYVDIDWQVTEALPRTREHKSSCHYEGSCVDANFMNDTKDLVISASSNEELKRAGGTIAAFAFIAECQGLEAVYEVVGSTRKEQLLKQNSWLRNEHILALDPEDISAEHFSVYDKGASAQNCEYTTDLEQFGFEIPTSS